MVQNWTADMATSLQKLSCCHLLVGILVPLLHYAGRVATRLLSLVTRQFTSDTNFICIGSRLASACRSVTGKKWRRFGRGGFDLLPFEDMFNYRTHAKLFLLKCSIWCYCWNVNSTQYYCQTISLSAVGVFHIVLLFECSMQCYC